MHKRNEVWTGNVVGRMHVYGIKMDELARKCGWSPQYLSMLLNGKKSFANVDSMANAKRTILYALDKLEEEIENE